MASKQNSGFEKQLTEKNVDIWLKNATERRVNLYLPKFEFRQNYNLNNYLANNGKMPSAFNNYADFSGISEEEGLFIKDVLHQAYIKVDKNGTEASAATAVLVFTKIFSPLNNDKPVEMIVDHPFYFIIRERIYGGYLFLGGVNNPNKK